MERVVPLFLDDGGDLVGRLHRRVRARLVPRGLDDHPAGRFREGLGAGDIGDGDVDVVVAREDVGDADLRHGLRTPPRRRLGRGRGRRGRASRSRSRSATRTMWSSFARGLVGQ